MATEIKRSKRMQALMDIMPEVRTVDADTVVDDQGPVRFLDARAPETQHITADGLKKADFGGEFYTQLYEKLWNESGMNNVYRTGKKGYYGRDLGGLQDKYGNDFMDKAVHEGIATPQNQSQRELYDMGVFERAFQQDVSGETKDDMWSQARESINNYQAATSVGIRKTALNEKQLREYQDYYGDTFSPFFNSQVQFRHPGRTLDNESYSDFGGGWLEGWQGIKESLNNAISLGGDVVGSQMMFDRGQLRADISRYDLQNMPRIKNDFTEVENFGDFVDWAQTASGVALPYVLGIVGSAVAGAVVTASAPITGILGTIFGAALTWQAPMAWVYAGEVYGNMEGDMDQRNAAIGLGGGIAMASLDRLGLAGLFSAGQVLKRQGLEEVAAAYAKKEGVSLDVARLKVQDVFGNLTVAALKDLDTIATLQMSKSVLAKQTGKGVLAGAGIEGLTEIFQESISYQGGRLGTDESIRKPFDMDEYKRIMANAAAGGIFLGGAIRGTSTFTSEVGGFQKLKRQGTNAEIQGNYLGGRIEDRLDNMVANVQETKIEEEQKPPTAEYGTPEYYNQQNTTGTLGSRQSIAEEINADVKKGDMEDKSKWRGGLKTVYQTFKEFPKRFTQKLGAFWENKVLNNPNISEKGKEAFVILQTLFGSGKFSNIQGVDLFEMKRMMQSGLMAETKTIQDDLYLLMGVGIQINGKLHTGKTKVEANNLFLEYLEERANKKSTAQVSAKFKPYVNKLEELRLAIGGQESRGNGVTDKLYDAVDGLIARTGPNKKPFWFQKSKRLKKEAVIDNKDEFIQTF